MTAVRFRFAGAGLALKPSEFPELLQFVGQKLITTDGTTLWGQTTRRAWLK
jgi:di/tripeptidase